MSIDGEGVTIRSGPLPGGNGCRQGAGPATAAQRVAPATPASRRHVISLCVSNKPGVLIRVALVFARRGINIDRLAVSEGHDPAFSHVTITASGEDTTLRLILGQLNKLVDVVKDRTGEDLLRRELALIKLRCAPHSRGEILQIAQMFGCAVAHVTDTAITLQCAGEPEKIDALHRLGEGFGVLEMVRTGELLIARGEETAC